MSRLAFVLCVLAFALPAAAQPAPPLPVDEEGSVHYVTVPRATVYSAPDSGRAYVSLGFRETVRQLGREGRWAYVRTGDGARGYVPAAQLSNVWIRVVKHRRTLYLYRGARLIDEVPIDLGFNGFADKEQRGSQTNPDDWRTPEGSFFIANKNSRSQFYKALVLNYPAAEDAQRGLEQGLISRSEHGAIVQAEAEYRMPPMNTALGGWIEIHGRGTGARTDWTQGCVAIRDEDIDRLWRHVEVGTPVLVER